MTEGAGGFSGDFSISPDGKTIIASSTHTGDAGATTTDLWILPSDGSTPPKFFAGAPGVDDRGPRFVAEGRQILWTQGSLATDGGTHATGGGLMIANADGTHVRSLFAQSDTTVVIAGSNSGFSCAWAGPVTGGTGIAFLLVAAALLLLRTRRRT